MKEWDAEGKKLKVTAVGNKGFGFMMRAGATSSRTSLVWAIRRTWKS
jgi:hypothetical protein